MRLRPAVLPLASVCIVAIALLSSGPACAAKRASAANPDAAKSASAPAAARGPVDANTADAAALQGVPGIGPAIAARIVAERGKRPFSSLDDFDDRVKGVGDATLRRMVAGGLIVVAAPAASATPAAARRATSAEVVRVAGGQAPAVPLGRVITVAGPDAAGATPRGTREPSAGMPSAGEAPAGMPSAGMPSAGAPSVPARR